MLIDVVNVIHPDRQPNTLVGRLIAIGTECHLHSAVTPAALGTLTEEDLALARANAPKGRRFAPVPTLRPTQLREPGEALRDVRYIQDRREALSHHAWCSILWRSQPMPAEKLRAVDSEGPPGCRSWHLGRLPCRRERYRRDRRDTRCVGLSRRILQELHDNRRVTPSGAGVVPLVRKLDKVGPAERGGDATSVLGRSPVVEVAHQNQRWNVAAHGGTRRRAAESRKPFLAIAAHDAPEWGAHHGVHRLQGFQGGRAVVVVTVDELAHHTVRQGLGRQAISHDLA